MRQKKKNEITLGSVIKWLQRPNRSHDGPCAHAFSRLHGELQLRADIKTPMEGPFLEWLAEDVVELILRLKPEVGDPLVLPMNEAIATVHTDDPDWSLYSWMLETRLVDQAVDGMLPQAARDYQDVKLNTRLLAKLRKTLVLHRLWGRDNSAGVHLTADEVRELIHRLPAEIDIPEGVDAATLRLSVVVQRLRTVGTTSGKAQPLKVIVPTNEDVSRVCNLVAKGMPVQTAAKQVAEISVDSGGTLKTLYYKHLKKQTT